MNGSAHIVTDQIVVFTLDEQFYGFQLHSVIKVINAMEIRHLPESPDIISGIVNIKGQILPVADIRKRFGLKACEMDLNDQIIIVDTGRREIAIPVDNVTGIRHIAPMQMFEIDELKSFGDSMSGVAKTDDGLVLIYNLNSFLTNAEERNLDQSLKKEKNESKSH